MNTLILFIYINIVLLLTISTIDAATMKRCDLLFKCSLDENPVSATDGKRCYVFRNNCMLANENCHRKNKCEAELRVITREKCKSMCNEFCPTIYKPVCCYNKETQTTFSNGCELSMYICQSAKTCISVEAGACDCEL